jgi:hypothetical protein
MFPVRVLSPAICCFKTAIRPAPAPGGCPSVVAGEAAGEDLAKGGALAARPVTAASPPRGDSCFTIVHSCFPKLCSAGVWIYLDDDLLEKGSFLVELYLYKIWEQIMVF